MNRQRISVHGLRLALRAGIGRVAAHREELNRINVFPVPDRDTGTNLGFMLGALRRLIDPGAVVFDVGANIGMYVRFMLCRFNAGRVVAFEPMRENLPLLQRNIHRGGCADRVQVMNVALADYDGSDAFQIDDMSSASGTLDVVAQGAAAQGRRQYGLPPKVETVQMVEK